MRQTYFFVIRMMYGSWDMERNRHNFLWFWTVFSFLPFYPHPLWIQKIKIIWCIVPEIWSGMGRTFCHFGLFFALLPPNNPKNQNFEKMKKTAGDIIILQMRTLNDNHMMYGTWDMEPLDRIFCHFGPFFALQST